MLKKVDMISDGVRTRLCLKKLKPHKRMHELKYVIFVCEKHIVGKYINLNDLLPLLHIHVDGTKRKILSLLSLTVP